MNLLTDFSSYQYYLYIRNSLPIGAGTCLPSLPARASSSPFPSTVFPEWTTVFVPVCSHAVRRSCTSILLISLQIRISLWIPSLVLHSLWQRDGSARTVADSPSDLQSIWYIYHNQSISTVPSAFFLLSLTVRRYNSSIFILCWWTTEIPFYCLHPPS